MVCLEAAIQGFSLKQLFYIYFGDPRGWHISSGGAGTMRAILVDVGSVVGIYRVNSCFLWSCP